MNKLETELSEAQGKVLEANLRKFVDAVWEEAEISTMQGVAEVWRYLNIMLLEADRTTPELKMKSFMNLANIEQNKIMKERDSE